jgi:hypothetical protein
MTTQYFGLDRGQQHTQVSRGTSTTGRAIELAVDDAVGIKKSEIVQALRAFEMSLLNDRSTPFT